MSKATFARLARRAIVAVATIGVLGVAVGTVQVAAQWRAENAPLVAAPVSMTTVSKAYAVETERSDDLANQMSGVAKQVSDLQAALIAANGSMAGGTGSATKLQSDLAAAKAKLVSIQKQLKAAQVRLVALNRAAARQSAINRSSRSTRSSSGSAPRATQEPREPEDPDHG